MEPTQPDKNTKDEGFFSAIFSDMDSGCAFMTIFGWWLIPVSIVLSPLMLIVALFNMLSKKRE